MHASVDVWPTAQNPACAIPVFIDYYPFQLLQSIPIFRRHDVGECGSCHRLIDKHFTRENDRLKCCWCQKVGKYDSVPAVGD
jgi:hypothetical protein